MTSSNLTLSGQGFSETEENSRLQKCTGLSKLSKGATCLALRPNFSVSTRVFCSSAFQVPRFLSGQNTKQATGPGLFFVFPCCFSAPSIWTSLPSLLLQIRLRCTAPQNVLKFLKFRGPSRNCLMHWSHPLSFQITRPSKPPRVHDNIFMEKPGSFGPDLTEMRFQPASHARLVANASSVRSCCSYYQSPIDFCTSLKELLAVSAALLAGMRNKFPKKGVSYSRTKKRRCANRLVGYILRKGFLHLS